MTIDGNEAADFIRALAPGSFTVTATPGAEGGEVLEDELEEVDDSPTAVAKAESLAVSTGWTLDLARSWVDELDAWTQNGRILHELPVRAGGVATAEQMRIAAGRPAGKFALSGFTGGTAKRFKRWAAATPGAEGLTLPVTTVYDPSIKGRQRAKAFKVEEQLVPLFRISLMQTQD
ncbi:MULTISPECIES: hypothetical protein [Pseudonocardia]|uniref:hypothetical protein n=1 Tax=Pseudonocardia TaxID=1847 RepID=UPI002096F740|nr:hypothetical protein [Pseudonocardia sp. McavD-2-B]MCO7193157.1 hypothetical protein [Pseudonocardia sp. McavD-2-B]